MSSASLCPQEGSVALVRMINFMGLNDVCVSPGIGFNVVIGPNGSGKSTLVSAITLALGGNLEELGRQTRPADFVNYVSDKDIAHVCVHLHRGTDGDFYKLGCSISRSSNEITYEMDDKSVDQAAIRKLTKRLMVQTDNLCQFLPQDVVREFPKMTPRQIFESTVRAVGDCKTLELHNKLVEVRMRGTQLENSLATMKDTCAGLQRRYNDRQDVIEDVTSTKELEDHLARLELREKYLRVFQLKRMAKLITKEVEEKGAELAKAVKEHEEAETAQKTHEKQRNENETILNVRDKDLNLSAEKLSSSFRLLMNLRKDLDECSFNIDHVDSQDEDRKRRAAECLINIQEKEERLRVLNEEHSLAEWHQLQQERGHLARDLVEKKKMSDDIGRILGTIQWQVSELKKQKSKMMSDDAKKLAVLKRQNSDTHKAVLWLRDNSSEFSTVIHEPIMMTLTLEHPSYAIYVQKLVGSRSLEAFVCEEAQGASKLMNCLRQDLKWRQTNVIHSAPPTPDQEASIKSPVIPPRLQPNFVDFVSDMFNCPPAVKYYLCQRFGLHRIPVFSADTEVPPQLIRQHYQKFFIDFDLFISKQSRYSKSGCHLINEDCTHDRLWHFDPSIDQACDIERINEQIMEHQTSLNKTDHNKKAVTKEIAKLEESIRCYTEKLNKVQNTLKMVEELRNEIKIDRNRLKSLQKAIPVSMVQEKEHLVERRKNLVQNQVDSLAEIMLSTQKHIEMRYRFLIAQTKLAQIDVLGEKFKSQWDDKLSNKNSAKTEKREAESRKKAAVEKFSEIYRQLEWVQGDRLKIPPSIQEKFTDMPSYLPELRAQMETVRSQLDALPKYSDQELKDAQEVNESLLKMKRMVKETQHELTVKRAQMKQLDLDLSKQVANLVDKINDKFSYLMEKAGYSGAIELEGEDKEEEGNGSNSYGLAVMVKFRGGRNSHRLSACVQSGGEQALATALYMMALQELTKVPFRCVDEINQGMDDTNERKVWELLLSTTFHHTAQYFYIAPRFPLNLPFSEDITVTFCYNGAIESNKGGREMVHGLVKKLAKEK